jgi:hypothetical protein
MKNKDKGTCISLNFGRVWPVDPVWGIDYLDQFAIIDIYDILTNRGKDK